MGRGFGREFLAQVDLFACRSCCLRTPASGGDLISSRSLVPLFLPPRKSASFFTLLIGVGLVLTDPPEYTLAIKNQLSYDASVAARPAALFFRAFLSFWRHRTPLNGRDIPLAEPKYRGTQLAGHFQGYMGVKFTDRRSSHPSSCVPT